MKYSLGKILFCSVDLTDSITNFSENLAKHFNSEIAKIVVAIDKLTANNQPKVDISSPIFSPPHYFP